MASINDLLEEVGMTQERKDTITAIMFEKSIKKTAHVYQKTLNKFRMKKK